VSYLVKVLEVFGAFTALVIGFFAIIAVIGVILLLISRVQAWLRSMEQYLLIQRMKRKIARNELWQLTPNLPQEAINDRRLEELMRIEYEDVMQE
jgi:hypothetical protein